MKALYRGGVQVTGRELHEIARVGHEAALAAETAGPITPSRPFLPWDQEQEDERQAAVRLTAAVLVGVENATVPMDAEEAVWLPPFIAAVRAEAAKRIVDVHPAFEDEKGEDR